MTSPLIIDGHFDPNIPQLLPHDKMYNIQIGTRLFRISGASLSSDGPSYFTTHFSKATSKSASNSPSTGASANAYSPNGTLSTTSRDVLFIDRSAEIFEHIYRHLQGYFIDLKDEVQYTMLIADAVYYNLPRLKALLRDTDFYYSRIGDKSFRIPKRLLAQPGDQNNFFQMTAETLYVDVENLIIQKKLLRPPPHSYSYVSRSPKLFNMLLDLLNGGSFALNRETRETLIRECRYYRFLNLEQRLINCKTSFNPVTGREEILMQLQDITKRGVVVPQFYSNDIAKPSFVASGIDSTLTSFQFDTPTNKNDDLLSLISTDFTAAPILKKHKVVPVSFPLRILQYKRPYVDQTPRELSFQIESNHISLIFNRNTRSVHVDIAGPLVGKMETLFQSTLVTDCNVNFNTFKQRAPDDEPHLLFPACLTVCDIMLNETKYDDINVLFDQARDQVNDPNNYAEMVSGLRLFLTNSIWKLGVEPNDQNVVLIGVKLDAFADLKQYNREVQFL
ncbi:Mrx16p KNAG_0I01010 [Huiozyma naganishii CBS 8797]|uniref:BTB domain-containing protein n=1 Tax=Huiozyma naganishii (strain ATCC MYA-139 / BCRC 22969 / CBS 8797 / KCTC 17520 / NBRC 10181 / NCYC 3082 / Yp74L-3) TaxID=1071383 RepID=J7S284_HUIN7|nr:hypothetical protein KNAG_0I01010 [Kazachstania naganishii CBS 8797]CCK71892.1 hypothetical protein KNAG_0I01010 [Kazachstania naganishii CBS 8797]